MFRGQSNACGQVSEHRLPTVGDAIRMPLSCAPDLNPDGRVCSCLQRPGAKSVNARGSCQREYWALCMVFIWLVVCGCDRSPASGEGEPDRSVVATGQGARTAAPARRAPARGAAGAVPLQGPSGPAPPKEAQVLRRQDSRTEVATWCTSRGFPLVARQLNSPVRVNFEPAQESGGISDAGLFEELCAMTDSERHRVCHGASSDDGQVSSSQAANLTSPPTARRALVGTVESAELRAVDPGELSAISGLSMVGVVWGDDVRVSTTLDGEQGRSCLVEFLRGHQGGAVACGYTDPPIHEFQLYVLGERSQYTATLACRMGADSAAKFGEVFDGLFTGDHEAVLYSGDATVLRSRLFQTGAYVACVAATGARLKSGGYSGDGVREWLARSIANEACGQELGEIRSAFVGVDGAPPSDLRENDKWMDWARTLVVLDIDPALRSIGYRNGEAPVLSWPQLIKGLGFVRFVKSAYGDKSPEFFRRALTSSVSAATIEAFHVTQDELDTKYRTWITAQRTH